jgi:hypothetical protein
MRVRHLLAFGAVLGAFGAADLQPAQAQSVRLVRFLISQENAGIGKANSLIARQNFGLSQLNLLYAAFNGTDLTPSQRKQAVRQIGRFRSAVFQEQNQINALASRLTTLDNLTLNAVSSFDPSGVTPYSNQAFINDSLIADIVNRGPYGTTPVTLTQ